MSTLKTTPDAIRSIVTSYPHLQFAPADTFYWSAKQQTVYYDPRKLGKKEGVYTLLHELGHALLQHKTFGSGPELLKLEVAAWTKAKELAQSFDTTITEDHIEHCLDSYRDWLHQRSVCPSCRSVSVEIEENTYRCFNCTQRWTVPVDQRTRCYRLKVTVDTH